jgi:3-phytase
MKQFLSIGIIFFVLSGAVLAQSTSVEVTSTAETVATRGDGATGVTVWLHPTDLSQSVLIGTDDNEGLGVYALDGTELQFLTDSGAMSNVDLRYNFPLGSERVALVAAGVKDQPLVNLYTVDVATRTLEQRGQFATTLRLNGLCMYHSRLTGTYFVIVNSERGELEQYALEYEDGEFKASLLRSINIGSEVEGCVADDELGRLYITEEETAVIWRYGAEPENGLDRRIVDATPLGRIVEQVEGITLYYGANGSGYLIASNEQNDSYLVFDRAGDNAFIGEFRLVASPTVDQVSEPNGIEVVNLPLNDQYPAGLLVTTDDVNSNPNADNNFKLVSWADVATALNLTTDLTYDPRLIGASDTALTLTEITVVGSVETQPVPAATDAADDPAIWIHPTDPSLSTIIGTDKRQGLVVYNLDGSILQQVNIGRVNNVDLRYNFLLNGQPTAIVAATNRTENTLVLYAIDNETRELRDVAARPVVSAVEEVYGVCLYVSPTSGKYYAFLNSADTGEVEQYELSATAEGKIEAQVVREWALGNQTEGCVADDELGMLYLGEEGYGIWKYAAEPTGSTAGSAVDNVQQGNLVADVEGMALYYTADGAGYLIVSSQGSSEFVIYERQGANAYVGKFRVIETTGIDAISGTDGLDVTNFPLGANFPQGVFVAQDDLNIDPNETQNFKLVPWENIAGVLNLTIDTTFDPRSIGR